MKIKKTATNNEYIQGGGVWVRNFAKKSNRPLSVHHLHDRSDYPLIMSNEQVNSAKPRIADENIQFSKVLIVSDGYDFEKRQHIISQMPPDVCVLAINGALKNWKLIGKRAINAYVINNPYGEATTFLPKHKYYPVCISSMRTNAKFTKSYLGDVYVYCPTPERVFGSEYNEKYFVDDYRNPVCAALGLAYQFGAEKVMLMCCDDSFEEKRDFAVQLKNGLWTYPQHVRSEGIIDANLYWLTNQENREVQVVNYSSGGDYIHATYINDEKDAISFFTTGEEPNGQ